MLRIKDLLKQKGNQVYSISPDDTIYNALESMAKNEIGALVVLDRKKLVGIISERDYARKVILKGKKSRNALVREIMTTKVITTHLEQKVNKCLSKMTKNRIRHLPVIENEQVIGLISIGDIRKKI